MNTFIGKFSSNFTHLSREIATPKKTYQDKRVHDIIQLIQKLALDLSTTHADKWNYLV